jgi:acetyl-CoA C-acetyltransferase
MVNWERVMTKPVFIVEATRTPIGSFLGGLSTVSAPVLGSVVIKALIEKTGLPAHAVNEVMMGCVLSAGMGQAPARQALRSAGLPDSVGALTINKVCGSGMKAVMLAASSIQSGVAECVIAGGMESMSQTPYYLDRLRTGTKMGNQSLIDGMIHDGLWDPYGNLHMGSCAELCATKYNITREAQDAFATESYQRAKQAVETGAFKREIVPVPVPQRKGEPVVFEHDEEPFKGDSAKLSTLRPAFEKTGTITAGNASTLNDGAAALLLASEAAVLQYGLKPLAKITGFTTHGQQPEWFTTAPVEAIKKLLAQTGKTLNEIDYFEVNEAFSVVAMVAQQALGIPGDRLNVRGGAVALGHPIGASGARILVTLLGLLNDYDKTRGIASLCIGGGEATAMMIERLS